MYACRIFTNIHIWACTLVQHHEIYGLFKGSCNWYAKHLGFARCFLGQASELLGS